MHQTRQYTSHSCLSQKFDQAQILPRCGYPGKISTTSSLVWRRAVCKGQAAERHTAPSVQILCFIELVRLKGEFGFIFKDAILVKKKKKKIQLAQTFAYEHAVMEELLCRKHRKQQNAAWFWPKGFFMLTAHLSPLLVASTSHLRS